MQEHAGEIAKGLSAGSYTISGGLIVSDWLPFIDHHAAAIGVLLGILTYITNFVFKCLHYRAALRKNET